jgi:predicted GIY-YIG superfamily endonuclease
MADKLSMCDASLWIYVLELAGGRYYVGESNDVRRRFDEHRDGSGAAWTRKYKPIKIQNITQCTGPTHEDATVKSMMAAHGIDMVRGGSYSNVVLTKMQIDALNAEMRGVTDACMRCGHSGHWVKDCFATRDSNGVFINDATSRYVRDSTSREVKDVPVTHRAAQSAAILMEPAINMWRAFGSALTSAITAIAEHTHKAQLLHQSHNPMQFPGKIQMAIILTNTRMKPMRAMEERP